MTSSASPENISLTIKSLATFAILFGADSTIVTQISNDLLSFIMKLLEVIALGYSIWGGVRKIKLGRWSAPERE